MFVDLMIGTAKGAASADVPVVVAIDLMADGARTISSAKSLGFLGLFLFLA